MVVGQQCLGANGLSSDYLYGMAKKLAMCWRKACLSRLLIFGGMAQCRCDTSKDKAGSCIVGIIAVCEAEIEDSTDERILLWATRRQLRGHLTGAVCQTICTTIAYLIQP